MRMGRLPGLVFIAVLGLAVGLGVGTWIAPLWAEWRARVVGSEAEKGPEAQAEGGRKVAFWKSSMIPNFVSPRPGQDPMGMALVPVYADEMGRERLISVDPVVAHNMGLRTVPVEVGNAEGTIRTVGTVDFAEPLLGDVTLKVEGWVEDLKVDYIGQRVEKGQPLFSIYSPELISAQEEYLNTLGRSRRSSIRPSQREQVLPIREKLRFWDVPDSEVEALEKRGRPAKTVTFRSPFEGWVVEKHALRGMHMDAGTRYYRIAGLETVWVYVAIYEFQLPRVKVGQSVTLELPYRPGEVFEGKVIYIYPSVDSRTRQVRVRLEFPNPETKLRPGMFGDVVILEGGQPAGGVPSVLVPRDAVIFVGRKQKVDGVERPVGYAYVQVGAGRFEPREVVLGKEALNGRVQVLSGLKEGERVVVSGQFELDGERKVKEANMRMLQGGPKAEAGPSTNRKTKAAPSRTDTGAGRVP